MQSEKNCNYGGGTSTGLGNQTAVWNTSKPMSKFCTNEVHVWWKRGRNKACSPLLRGCLFTEAFFSHRAQPEDVDKHSSARRPTAAAAFLTKSFSFSSSMHACGCTAAAQFSSSKVWSWRLHFSGGLSETCRPFLHDLTVKIYPEVL